MSLDFGKLDFAVSFNPLTAFPLDARSYFESYESAAAAAAIAVPVGSTDGTYYYGQTLIVVENNKANFYIIQPNKTLSLVTDENGKSINVDITQFELGADNTLSLKGYNSAEIGSFFTKGENGLTWAKPIDAYSKSETDNKIAAAAHLKRKIVSSITEIEEYKESHLDADQYIFMVPTGLANDSNQYDEYMVVIVTDSEGIETKLIEKVGSWEVDLNDYSTITYVDTELSKKVDKVEGSRLITLAEVEKLEGLEQSLIQSVNNTIFEVSEIGELNLKDLPINKIIDLQKLLNNKVDIIEGYTLLSPTDQEKLEALVAKDSGGLEFSGTIKASNIQNLETWLNAHASTVVGLSENNLTDELLNKLNNIADDAESNYVKSIDETQLFVDEAGKLSITAVSSNLISGLEDLLNNKANTSAVVNVEQELNSYKTTTDERLRNIELSLTWQSL